MASEETAATPSPASRGSASHDPGRWQVITLGTALFALAIVCGVLGYSWTRKPPFPRFPLQCLGYIKGSCWQEQSGAFLYVDNPNYPVALKVTFGDNVYGPKGTAENIWVGAKVPAGHTLHWMIQLYGVTRLSPQTFGPDVGGRRRRVLLDEGVTLTRVRTKTPNSGNTVQILRGSISGPADGFSTIKYETAVPVGFTVAGMQTVAGDTTGAVIGENSAYTLGHLPFIFAAGPSSTPGTPASPPDIGPGHFFVRGAWYYARRAFVDESYSMPVVSQLNYSSPSPSKPGDTDWQSDRYVQGTFELVNTRDQNRRQGREFWAGVALGVGGGALIGSIQTFALIPIRRRRRRRKRREGRRMFGWTGLNEIRRDRLSGGQKPEPDPPRSRRPGTEQTTPPSASTPGN